MQEREPIRIRLYVRAYCRRGQHTDCSAVQHDPGAIRAFVCTCYCHQED